MYTEYLEVKNTGAKGKGLFTTVEIPANVPIFEFGGTPRKMSEIPDPTHPALLQVGPETYLGPTGSNSDFINHSCNPNCRAAITGHRAIFYSLYVIPAGSELTFDYSTTSTESHETWKMECGCGSYKCRGVISGFQYLDTEQQEEYKQKGWVPIYLSRPNMIQR